MTQFDPADEKLEQAHAELKESVSEPELVPAAVEKSPAEGENASPNISKSGRTEMQPWKRTDNRRKPKKKFTWAPTDLESTQICAGFWRRLGAHLVDVFIVTTMLAVPYCLSSYPHSEAFNSVLVFYGMLMLDYVILFALSMVPIVGLLAAAQDPSTRLFMYAALLLDSTYHSLMESSSRQATIGKMLLRIHVTDKTGKRLTLLRAYARYFAKIVSSLTLCAGYIAIAFTKKKQGFHDMTAGTYVLKDYEPALLPSKAVPALESKVPPDPERA